MSTPPPAPDGSGAESSRVVLDPAEPLAGELRAVVAGTIAEFLDTQEPPLAAMGAELAPMLDLARRLLAGGKRLRPAFCLWGYVAAAGSPTSDLDRLLTTAASLELLHVSALVHDDVMDASDLRRGQPAAHRLFGDRHQRSGWVGEAETFGRAAAILLGDLLLMWSVELFDRAGWPSAALDRARPVVEAMRTEVTCGQYLDVVAQARPLTSGTEQTLSMGADPLAEARRVVEYKSARYTVARPAQLGAALAGGDQQLHEVLGAYGSALGRAFQYRDDLLGVFGDPVVTGKPAGDDLREGKRTVLVAATLAHADAAGRRRMRDRLGDPSLDADGIAELQDVITAAGARDAVEAMIADGHRSALAALDRAPMHQGGRTALTALAEIAVRRDS